MQFYGVSDVGRKRSNNEDFISIPNSNDGIMLFVLADGMGGAKAGETASSLATKTVKEYIRNNFIKIDRTKENLENLIRESINEANRVVFELSTNNPDYAGMGTTLLVLLAYNDHVYIGHVGDSRVYRARKNVFRQITKDHSYVQELVKGGTITHEEAKVHPNKNVLLRAVGVEAVVKPDIMTKAFLKSDILLMCSDGLTNMVSDQRIYEIIMKRLYDVNSACTALVEEANQNGGLDNVSTILILN